MEIKRQVSLLYQQIKFRTISLLAVLAALLLVSISANAEKLLVENKVFDGNTTTPLVLTAEHSGSVIRNSTFRNMKRAAISISGARDVLIENCRFENIRSRTPDKDTHAVECQVRCENVTIRRNKFVNIGADGVQLGNRGVEIRNIKILDNEFWVTNDDVGENGVDLKTVQGPVLVAGNSFHGFRPCDGKVQDCTGSPGEAMVVHLGAANVVIERNRFFNSVIGLRITRNKKPNLEMSPIDIVVRNNWFYDNLQTGLEVENVRRIKILNNTFLSNGTNLKVSGTPYTSDGSCQNANNLFAGRGGSSTACEAQHNATFSESEAGFVDLAGRNLHLSPGSPAIDLGGPVAGLKEDFDGVARPTGNAFDVGADEVTGSRFASRRQGGELPQKKSGSTRTKRR